MRELSNSQEKILDKALYVIGKNGSYNVPIRDIAKEANVNVNAINYYFRTKENMMDCVKEFYIDNTNSAYSSIYNDDYSDEEKLLYAGNEIMEYSLKYPGVLIILRQALKNKDSDEIDARIVKITEDYNKELYTILDRIIDDKDSLNFTSMIFLSSILHPAINGNTSSFDLGIIENKEKRLQYISYILNKLKK